MIKYLKKCHKVLKYSTVHNGLVGSNQTCKMFHFRLSNSRSEDLFFLQCLGWILNCFHPSRKQKIWIPLHRYHGDKRIPDLHLLPDVGLPETSQELLSIYLSLPNLTLCLLCPWQGNLNISDNSSICHAVLKRCVVVNCLFQFIWTTPVLVKMLLVSHLQSAGLHLSVCTSPGTS